MAGRWIFPTLFVALIITIWFESVLFVFPLILLVIRIIYVRDLRLVGITLILGLVFVVRCQILVQQHVMTRPNLRTVTISPDTLAINGDSLSGEMVGKGQTVRFVYRIKNKSEQTYWHNLNQIITARVQVKQVTKIKGPRNIGEFDYQKFLSHKNIFYTAQIETIDQQRIFQPQTIIDNINVLRIHIINYLANLPKWLRIHAQSLVVGYTGHDDKNFLKILSILGVIHLFSLSGLHVLILLTLIRKLTSALKIPLEFVDFAMLVLLPAYGLLVGSKSGIWRAIVLAMVGIICKRCKWSLSRLDIFSLTLMICLLIYPFAIVEMGGQLSFLLSFAILYLYRKTTYLLTAWKMNLVSLPMICFYTYQFNWLTLLTNIIFVPFFTYFILPVTVLSSLSVKWSFWNYINTIFERFYFALDLIANDMNFIVITGKFWSLAVLLLIVLVLFYVESKDFWNKYLQYYLLLFMCCILINKFPLFGSVHMIDVGQGDSILVTTPGIRQTFLIDVAGKLPLPSKPWAKHDTSNQVDNSTIPLLKSAGISQIDKIFLTHKDVDHVGNLETILTKFHVKEVNFGIGLEDNPRIKRAIKQHPQVKFKNLRQGNVVDTGFIKWQVLWPKVKSVGENGDSLTLFAKIKNKKWLFTGDLDTKAEQDILSDHKFTIDYLKVGHHGSRTSTGEQLLNTTKPHLGLISSGINNRYGHPNKETIERLDKHRVQYLNTAEYGMISWYYSFWNDEGKITTFLKGDLLENNRTKK